MGMGVTGNYVINERRGTPCTCMCTYRLFLAEKGSNIKHGLTGGGTQVAYALCNILWLMKGELGPKFSYSYFILDIYTHSISA